MSLTKINVIQAEIAYYNGAKVILCTSKFYPVGTMGINNGTDIPIQKNDDEWGSGDFQKKVNNYSYYNCTSETGNTVHYYITDEYSGPFSSRELFSTVVAKADASRGAPMGRMNVGNEPNKYVRVFDRAVPFVDGAYDKGGAYWGYPANLRVKYSACLSFIHFYRTN